MWPFKSKMYTVDVDAVLEDMQVKVRISAETAAKRAIEMWFAAELDITELNLHRYGRSETTDKRLIERRLNTFFEEKYKIRTEIILRAEVARYVSSEEFLDKVIARINNKQVGGK